MSVFPSLEVENLMEIIRKLLKNIKRYPNNLKLYVTLTFGAWSIKSSFIKPRLLTEDN